MKLPYNEYLTERQEEVIAEMFGVPTELASEAIQKVGKDIKRIKAYIVNHSKEKAVGKCRLCGKRLTDPESVRRGYGEECYLKMRQRQFDIFDINKEE